MPLYYDEVYNAAYCNKCARQILIDDSKKEEITTITTEELRHKWYCSTAEFVCACCDRPLFTDGM